MRVYTGPLITHPHFPHLFLRHPAVVEQRPSRHRADEGVAVQVLLPAGAMPGHVVRGLLLLPATVHAGSRESEVLMLKV